MKKFKTTLASAALKRQNHNRSEPGILDIEQIDLDSTLENFDYDKEIKDFFAQLLKSSINQKASGLLQKLFKELLIAPSEAITIEAPNKHSKGMKPLEKSLEKLGTGKPRGRKRKNPLILKEEEEEKGEKRKGFARKIKEFVENKDLGEEKNMKKRKVREFSEFLENDGGEEGKKKGKSFL